MNYEQGVKDYVEQQKKLQKDISELLDRNLTALREKERIVKEQEEKRQESERQLKEAAEDTSKPLDETGVYIPPEDTIHRPKLLFIPQLCPEQELDSPVRGEFVFEIPPSAPSNTLTFPPSTDILSPQYCVNPKATAKKIFSVTQVTSPLQMPSQSDTYFSSIATAASCVVNSPTSVHPPVGRAGDTTPSIQLPQLCIPLPTVDIKNLDAPIPLTVDINTNNINPNAIQKGMADQTLENYIQQIVGENTAETVKTKNGNSENKVENSEIEVDEFQTDPNCKKSRFESEPNKCDIADEKLKPENSQSLNTENQVMNGSNCDILPEVKPGTEEASENETEHGCFNDCENGGGNTDCSESVDSEVKPAIELIEDCVQSSVAEDGRTVIENTGDTDSENNITGAIIKESDFKCDNANDVVGETSHEECDKSESAEITVRNCNNSSFGEKISADKPVEASSPTISGSGCVTENDTIVKTAETTSNNVNHLETQIQGNNNIEQDDEFVQCGSSLDSKNVYGSKADNSSSGISELCKSPDDSEPWSTVNVDCTMETVKPDFHTSFSMNGLKQELASLIDEETTVANGAIPHSKLASSQESGYVYSHICI